MLSRPKPKGKPISPEEHGVWSELKEPTERRPPPARRKAQPVATPGGDRKQDGDDEGSKIKTGEEEAKKEKETVGKEDESKEEMKILDETEGQV